ncbi:MAG: phage holin family protein [Oscillospiraceae bacterium]|jgi:toxin secretion/phage lysis holin|nr:phage holin family protein [Oscillospiraceae bacterium]
MGQTKELCVKAAAAFVAATAARLLGGADVWLYTLVAFTLADYVSGTAKAALTGKLSSRGAFAGGLRKILVYVVVGLAAALDNLLPGGALLRNLTVGYYIAEEGLSVIENLGACGVRYPKKFGAALAALKSDDEKR